MKRILFLCLGSICRSPAAEMLFRLECKKRGIENEYEVTSLALSSEEEGNPIYPPMKRELFSRGIPLYPHTSRKVTQKDLEEADEIFYMDGDNLRRISYLFSLPEGKAKPIFAYTERIYEIEDPWYTGRYAKVVDEIQTCVQDILDHLEGLSPRGRK